MAISAYTGPPGAGKSYAMVEQVIVPGVESGRRVLTNIDGVKPDAVRTYCIERGADPDTLGEVVLFHGDEAKKDGFWPTELTEPGAAFVQGGDLVVFDEWALYWRRRGKQPTDELEAFLRYHRHLTAEIAGREVACDVVIGTQLISDVSLDFRGLIESSYKFKKLTGVGLGKAFVWDAYEGHLQPKGGKFKSGNGTYKPEIFELYSSYQGGKGATELVTDKRRSIGGRWLYYAGAVGLAVAIWAGWTLYEFFTGKSVKASVADVAPGAVAGGRAPLPMAARAPSVASSNWRIVGFIEGYGGTRVLVASRSGSLRMMMPVDFDFDDGRPVSGTVDGERVVAEDRFEVAAPASAAPFMPGAGL